MEKNRNKTAHTWLIDFQQRCLGNSMGKRIVFPINCAGLTMYSCRKVMNFDSSTLYTKINLKWIIDLNIKAKSIKLPVKSIQENLGDLDLR